MHLRLRPLQRLRKILHRPRMYPRAHIPLHKLAQKLKPRIPRPAIDRNRKDLLLNIHEPRLLIPRLHLVGYSQRHAERHGGAVLGFRPFEELVGGGHGAVVAVDFWVELVRLHVAAGLEIVEAFLDDCAEVFEDAEGHAGVDVVVGLGAVPPFFAADVVDEEVDVVGGAGVCQTWWQVGCKGGLHVGLDGREVDAFDLMGVRWEY